MSREIQKGTGTRGSESMDQDQFHHLVYVIRSTEITCLVLDNTRILLGHLSGCVDVWDVRSRRLLYTWQAHSKEILSLKTHERLLLR